MFCKKVLIPLFFYSAALSGRPEVIPGHRLIKPSIGRGGHAEVSLWRGLVDNTQWVVKCSRQGDGIFDPHLFTEVEAMGFATSLGLAVNIETVFDRNLNCIFQTYADGETLADNIDKDSTFVYDPTDDRHLALVFFLAACWMSQRGFDTHSRNIVYSKTTKHWSIIDPKHGAVSSAQMLSQAVDSWSDSAARMLNQWERMVKDKALAREKAIAFPIFLQTVGQLLE